MKFRKSYLKGSLFSLLLGLIVVGVLCVVFGGNADKSYCQNGFDLDEIPAFSEEPYVVLHDNAPYFTDAHLSETSYETYSPLDEFGRCGICEASVGVDLMPTEERGEIGTIHPSGWRNVKYNDVDGKYLYNRCHLIGYQLSGENANERNLITGTRYLNVDGMLPFENMIADFVKETEYHVQYRVTPVFEGDNLVARGVILEARSVEDHGDGVEFCVFCYNAQPGITIDYATGESRQNEVAAEIPETNSKETVDKSDQVEKIEYILNTNSKKFHLPDCSGAEDIKAENRQDYTGTRDELIEQGYSPCGKCKP